MNKKFEENLRERLNNLNGRMRNIIISIHYSKKKETKENLVKRYHNLELEALNIKSLLMKETE